VNAGRVGGRRENVKEGKMEEDEEKYLLLL
jgi:hypothetical protein